MNNYWFVSTKYRRHSKLALIAFALAFVVILLGAYTRLTNAGLSCPDWPHCFGYLTAPHTPTQLQGALEHYPLAVVDVKRAWTEMTHRYFAGTEGILIIALAFTLFAGRKAKGRQAPLIACLLVLLLGIQVTLGMLTVTEKLKPVIVLGHLLTGISILSVLWWAYLALHLHDDSFLQRTRPTLRIWLWVAFFIVAAQITLGGWVSTHSAGLACVDFPYCNGKILPPMHWYQFNTDLITIHMLHRIGALITATYLCILSFILLSQRSYRFMGLCLMFLIGAQITLGILNIIWLRPVPIALLHQSVGILLLLTVITALVKANFSVDKHHGKWLA